MPLTKKVLAIVLAGGEGNRLMPLTADRAKPAVPFAGSYRLIDFALSNLVNSRYLQIVVLTQYKSHSLDRHISETWRMSTQLGNYIASVPAQQRVGKSWFLGSANAIYQSLNLIHDANPDIVVVVGADHVYRMDFAQMVAQHVNSGAKATVAAVRQPLHMADQFGVIEVDQNDPQKIAAFVEKPSSTPGLAADPSQFLASMGNYVFDADALVAALHVDAERLDTKHDMGGDIIPYFVNRGEAGVYDFTLNDIPGSTERDRTYWRDVGTIDSFYDAHMDLISPLPVFNLYNSEWPIYTRQSISPPAKFVRGKNNTVGTALDSIVSSGVVISGGVVEGSVLSNDVYVATSGRVIDSVLMDKVQVGEGAVINRAILDKNVKVPAGAAIGLDPDLDRARGFKVTDSGITVLAKGQEVPEPGEEERRLAARHLSQLPNAVKAATDQYPNMREAADKVADTHAAAAAEAAPGARVS
ncbi:MULTISPECIES: glucose-1-phosphate adenylyltransferase [unclassified Arthrobacter]|jgi:glucose-1-phosphate adenylyltransferase|uniref:glucose-1-phosphate adenylyltransferase n=1 Tax=Micrococcaceae TaxID=1268 RepID=UPI00036FA3E0|nr:MULTISPECIES: glucose-1-phosphate adenylyltransferase [unclassified Arthrobacter]KRE73174.1 glucose-1-phosphate adenylyltransferase [Arthrobacter sp. Soil761]TWD56300.1 glucose-1-phosphate adenylyltransferase [Arthrobacter sp. AG367]BCW54602.1 glucose-1-phosphate adenylyltransferase [Arthrobacter sp. StoSoilB19]BCW75654.1 glucose-1-phosphate adenylyltransferase [Arthrobacter sp. NicSoilB11]